MSFCIPDLATPLRVPGNGIEPTGSASAKYGAPRCDSVIPLPPEAGGNSSTAFIISSAPCFERSMPLRFMPMDCGDFLPPPVSFRPADPPAELSGYTRLIHASRENGGGHAACLRPRSATSSPPGPHRQPAATPPHGEPPAVIRRP